MGKEGKCCDSCDGCGSITPPDGSWTIMSDCCIEKTISVASPVWVEVCTTIRTHTFSGSVTFEQYLRTIEEYTSDDFLDPEDLPNDVPNCDDTPFICGTLVQSTSGTQKDILKMRYRITGTRITILRVKSDCGSGLACRYLVFCRKLFDVQYQQFVTYAYTYSKTETTTGCCTVLAMGGSTTVTEPTCAGLTLTGTIFNTSSCRSRQFDTMPTGSLDFINTDHVSCSPLSTTTFNCFTECTEGFTVTSTSSTTLLLFGPVTCTTSTITEECKFLHRITSIPNYCSLIGTGATLSRLENGVVADDISKGSIVSGPNFVGLTNSDACKYTACSASGDPPLTKPYKYRLGDLLCVGLTQSHADTGHAVASLSVDLGTTWTITI